MDSVSFEDLFEPGASSPFGLDTTFGDSSFLSFSSFAPTKEPASWLNDEPALAQPHQHKGSFSGESGAFQMVSPVYSATSSEPMSTTPPTFTMTHGSSPSIAQLPLPPSMYDGAGFGFPYDNFTEGFQFAQENSGSGRTLNSKVSTESFASTATAASCELLLTPHMRPATTSGAISTIDSFTTPVSKISTVIKTPATFGSAPPLQKRHSSYELRLPGESPAGMQMGAQGKRRVSAVPLTQTLDRVAEEMGEDMVAQQMLGQQLNGMVMSSTHLMPSAEIVGNINNWQATVPTFASQQEFDAAIGVVMAPQMYLDPNQGQVTWDLSQFDAGSFENVRPETSHAPMVSTPLKSAAMRKTKSMDHSHLRKASGSTPKALFAFHPNPMPSGDHYPAAFSTMPLSMGMARSDTSMSQPQSQPLFVNDVFGTPAPVQQQSQQRMSVSFAPRHVSTYTAPQPGKPIPSVLMQPATTVDPAGEVFPPLPPRAPVPTISPFSLTAPLVPSTINYQSMSLGGLDMPMFPVQHQPRMSISAASVMQPAPMAGLPLGLESMEGWEGESKVSAPPPPPEAPAPPVLTCAPLARPSISVEPTKVIAPLPKPRVRAPSKSQPKPAATRKPSKSGAPAFGFINFTANDADKLLTGVAPSGSQKRKREASGSIGDAAGLLVDAKKARL